MMKNPSRSILFSSIVIVNIHLKQMFVGHRTPAIVLYSFVPAFLSFNKRNIRLDKLNILVELFYYWLDKKFFFISITVFIERHAFVSIVGQLGRLEFEPRFGVVPRRIGANVLNRSMGEYFVVNGWWKLLLRISTTTTTKWNQTNCYIKRLK